MLDDCNHPEPTQCAHCLKHGSVILEYMRRGWMLVFRSITTADFG